MSRLLLTGISQLVTAPGRGARRGPEMKELSITADAAMLVVDGRIAWLGSQDEWRGDADEFIDLDGHAVLPGLVDPHTHAVWAGDRLRDFEARCSGATYEEILAAGGGIWHTVRETAQRSCAELVELAKPRLEALIRSGATTIEVKSGYGYEPEAEIRMLEAVRELQPQTSARLVPTLLIHVCPKNAEEKRAYLKTVCETLIPETARRKLASTLDIFVEQHAWSAEDTAAIIAGAKEYGFAIKLHTEQFNRVGGLELGIEAGALSVDHLEACTLSQCVALAASSTIATILPGVTLHLGLPAAPGRALIDAGAAVALGTDLNPGSSPLFSISATIALATRLNGLSPAEALTAATANAAAALGINDAGRLAEGMPADFIVLDNDDWREIAYALGKPVVSEVWIRGRKQP